MEEMHLMVNHVQECTQFTIDTESEKSNGQLALIQIQTKPSRLPLLVILIELQHLPPNNLSTYGNMDKELDPTTDSHLFNWPTLASMIGIQLYFSDWYEWALIHCESCRPNCHQLHHPDGVDYDNVITQNYSSSVYKALAYAAHMLIDKLSTVSDWTSGLTSNNSKLSIGRRKKMII
ncbi:unnamed protein product [Rotaria sp. Silwood2]|nr:unnamed protein product [Rotaria sp. Silwood2]CAF4476063.1 unnamed protein product [Rotaria sp. Silwood2]